MYMPGRFKYSQLVAVHVPDTKETKMLLKYNGQCHRISGHKRHNSQMMYMLEGCYGRDRVPYWFAEDWIRELD